MTIRQNTKCNNSGTLRLGRIKTNWTPLSCFQGGCKSPYGRRGVNVSPAKDMSNLSTQKGPMLPQR